MGRSPLRDKANALEVLKSDRSTLRSTRHPPLPALHVLNRVLV